MDKKGERHITTIQYSSVQCKQYEWIIRNLGLCSFNSICSPEFTMGKHENFSGEITFLKWIIKLTLKENEPLEIYLILQSVKNMTIKCAFQFFNGDSLINNSVLKFNFGKNSLIAGPLEGLTIKQKDLKNNDFKIACSIFESTNNEIIHKTLEFTAPKPDLNLTSDYKNLLLNKEFSDLILKTKTQEFNVHKTILIARSAYFMAALKSNMKEKQENTINMSEDDNIVIELLNYIYTGEVENIESISKDLFIAADKYQLEGLKKTCIYELYKNVNIENAAEWLSFADQYNSKEMERHLIKYIHFNYKEISKTDSFKLLSEKKPNLVYILDCLS